MTEVRSWLVLAVQLPAHPAYLRVKLWRRLRDAGALSIPGGLYMLPDTAAHRDTFAAILVDATTDGGHATFLSSTVIDATSDPIAAFCTARAADYRRWIGDADRLLATSIKASDLARMRRRLDRIDAVDFFRADGRAEAESRLRALIDAAQRHPDVSRSDPGRPFRIKELHGRTWVTRRGVGIDRIACAWLINRFIDPRPRFRFVDPGRYVHQRRDLRFDMAEGEFTHVDDRCSFETILHQTGTMLDPGLAEIATVIHQLDIDDGKFALAEAEAVGSAITAICRSTDRDALRLSGGFAVLDQLYGSRNALT